jgi:hypothetical protein
MNDFNIFLGGVQIALSLWIIKHNNPDEGIRWHLINITFALLLMGAGFLSVVDGVTA